LKPFFLVFGFLSLGIHLNSGAKAMSLKKNRTRRNFVGDGARDIAGLALAMFTHAPIITKKVEKPYVFFLIRRDSGEIYSPDKKA
jgi:hypothetical protein